MIENPYSAANVSQSVKHASTERGLKSQERASINKCYDTMLTNSSYSDSSLLYISCSEMYFQWWHIILWVLFFAWYACYIILSIHPSWNPNNRPSFQESYQQIEKALLFSRFHRPRVVIDFTNGRYQSPYWRSFAATRIQVAWRYRKKRLSRAHTSGAQVNWLQ